LQPQEKDMRKLFIGIILILNGIACYGQYTLPSVIADSLIFETIKGRECANLTELQAVGLIQAEKVIHEQGQAIELLKSQINTLEQANYNWEHTLLISNEQWEREIKHYRRKLIGWKLLAVGQVVLLVLVL
jgi:hypothetical protein